MTSFAINSGGTEYYDAKTGGSTNATNDTYTISAGSTFVIRTDTYACPNHSSVFGSLDNVGVSGIGGTLKFDATYTREVAFTGGSGTVPAYGTTISQGGVSGVFLGVWADWQSSPVAPTGAMPAAGYIKLGGITGGSFAAGALTGITATCSGADKQSWIEVLMNGGTRITANRLLTVKTDATTWYELGTTSGSRGQVFSCPATGGFAGVFPGIWVETGSGTGVYERWFSVGTMAATATTRTDASCKMFWQTTSGIRIGSDGTNNVGFLPPSGCKVRIPAVILNNCTRTVSGSGSMVLPNNNMADRAGIVTTGGGAIDLKGVASFIYGQFSGAYSLALEDCAFNQYLLIESIKSTATVTNIIISPNQSQSPNPAFLLTDCNNGPVLNGVLALQQEGYGNQGGMRIEYCTNAVMTNLAGGFTTKRSHISARSIVFKGNTTSSADGVTMIGAGASVETCTSQNIKNPVFYDSLTTDIPTGGTGNSGIYYTNCSGKNVLDGFNNPLPLQGPYYTVIEPKTTANLYIKNIGTYASPLNLGNLTNSLYGSLGGNSGIRISRCYLVNTKTNPYSTALTDSDFIASDFFSDYADATTLSATNAILRGCGFAGSSSATAGVYGTHWQWRFLSTTTGVVQLNFNEPTSASAAQSFISAGAPRFDGAGALILATSGDQMTWETPYYVLGYTAFANSLPTITGTNAASAGSGVWGNHLLEFAVNTGSGYGSWLTLTGANLSAQSITASTGFKLKIRATCQVTSSTNALTNLNISMVTTSADQSTNLYPMGIYTLTLTGLVSGSDIVIRQAGTSTILEQVDANSGTTYAYSYETPQAVDILIFKAGYKVKSQRNYSLASADVTLPLAQTVDLNYA